MNQAKAILAGARAIRVRNPEGAAATAEVVVEAVLALGVTDAEVEKASAEFAAWRPSRPSHRAAMRAALEAARDA